MKTEIEIKQINNNYKRSHMNSSHYFLLLLCPLSSLWLVGLFCARSFFVFTTTAIFAKKKVPQNVWIKLVNFDHYFGIRFFNPKEEIRSKWKLWKNSVLAWSWAVNTFQFIDWLAEMCRLNWPPTSLFRTVHARSYRCTDENDYSTKYFQLQLIIQKY